MDCAGLLAVALAALGVTVEDRRGVSRGDVYGAMVETLSVHAVRVGHGLLSATEMFGESEWSEPMPGDALVFRGRAMANHLALATGGGRMVHSCSSVGRVIEQPMTSPWVARCTGVWRYKGAL